MPIILALLLLTSCVYARQNVEVESQIEFTGGINTTISSHLIKKNETQDCANVYLDGKGITTRGGQLKRNASAIGGGSSDVNNVFEYKKSDGTDYCVGFSSTTGYYSTDKCVSFTAFMSTLTRGQDVNCDVFQDRLYCVNGADTSFYFDGTNDIGVSALPVGKYIRTHQNRLWVAGVSGNLSRLYFSNVGDGTTWDTTLQYVDFNPEDGDTISGIGPPIFEVLPVYKTYSSWVCQGRQADDYTPVIINKNIGAKYHRSIQNFLVKTKNIQVFDSLGPKGGQPGIYYFNGIVVDYASEKIEEDLRLLPNFRAASRYKQWTTQADWNSGTLNWVDSTIDVNAIAPSSWTATDTSADDFGAGTLTDLTTSQTAGSLQIDQGKFDYFTDGDYTADPTWTNQNPAISWSVTNGVMTCATTSNGTMSTPSTIATGRWEWSTAADASANYTMFYFIANDDYRYDYTLDGYLVMYDPGAPDLAIYRMDDGQATQISSHTLGGVLTLTDKLNVTRNGTGLTCLYLNGTAVTCTTDNTYTSSSYILLQVEGDAGVDNHYFDNINVKNTTSVIPTSGTFISQKFNTALSTPTGGTFDVSFDSHATDTSIFFDVREASTTHGAWGSWTATSDTLRVPLTKQWWQYRTRFHTNYSTATPQLHDVTLQAASTGTWTAGEAYLSDDMSATWGLLQSDEVTADGGAWSYEMKSSTYSGGTAQDSWHSVTNNAQISIATGAYIDVRVTNSFPSSTSTAKINSITVYYNEGAQAESTTAEIYKGRYYWFGQSVGGTENDIAYCLDSNLAWTYHTGIYARSASIIDGGLYTGDSRTSSSGFIWEQDTGTNDGGSAFTAYWQSKDHILTLDEIHKSVENIYVTYEGEDTASDLTVQLYGDGTEADSWTIDISTSNPFGIKKCHIATATGGKRASYFNVKFTDSDPDVGATVLGYRLYWRPVGYMP